MVQAIIDVIILRFALFMAASLVLLVLTIRAAFPRFLAREGNDWLSKTSSI
jgi:hypothetical protein